ncbi:MAG: Phosphatidylserine decarboxylase proenzyme [Patescibacteria group bacterium]|nr:Phosphatidylserine decarboxylase proenzyme [Patescibacteria group bacterium]
MKKFFIPVGALVILVIAFVLYFGRAPFRIIPADGIVSPSSGTVIAVYPAETPDIIFAKKGVENLVVVPEIPGPVTVVLIELTPADVHVQRAPISGAIVRMDHYDGDHKNALGRQKLTLASGNEKVVSVFKNDQDVIGVVQVAGRAARRIRNSAHVGDSILKGAMYGRIILGSQTVVILPQSKGVLVHVGDKVVDGETVIAK